MNLSTILALQVFGLALVCRGADVVEVPSTRVYDVVDVSSPGGKIRLPAATARIASPDQQTPTGEILVVFDPGTKHFIWRVRSWAGARGALNASPSPGLLKQLHFGSWVPGPHVLYSYGQAFTEWTLDRMTLDVRISTETAADLREAFSMVIAQLRSGGSLEGVQAEHVRQKKIGFGGDSLRDFDRDNFLTSPDQLIPGIRSIDRVDDGYRLRLGNMWVGELIIGDDLTIKEPFHRRADSKP